MCLTSSKRGVYASLLGGSSEPVDGVEGLPSTVAANLISSSTLIVSVSDTSSMDAVAWGT